MAAFEPRKKKVTTRLRGVFLQRRPLPVATMPERGNHGDVPEVERRLQYGGRLNSAIDAANRRTAAIGPRPRWRDGCANGSTRRQRTREEFDLGSALLHFTGGHLPPTKTRRSNRNRKWSVGRDDSDSWIKQLSGAAAFLEGLPAARGPAAHSPRC